MTEREWKALLEMLERQTCVLLLGTESLPAAHELSAWRLSQQLAVSLNRPELAEQGLAHVAERYENSMNRLDLEIEVRSFHEQRVPVPPLFAQVAALPFPLVLTTCHDDLLFRAFEERGKTPVSDVYKYKGSVRDLVQLGTVDSPLVYSLYGSPSEPGSLVLTETDLLDFLVHVITGNPGLPRNIRSELQKNIGFLFLGFGVDQWYLRILLHVLEFSRKKRAFAFEPLRLKSAPADSVVFFYAGYSIDVIKCDLDEFIGELSQRFEAHMKARGGSQPKGLAVRQLATPRIFICYASEDRRTADGVLMTLETAGFDVWMDRTKLEGGDNWNRAIEDRMKDSDYCVVLHTTTLAKKNFSYVNKEIHLALDRQHYARRGVRFIIPAQCDDAPIMAELQDFQAVSIRTNEDMSGLVSAIKRDYQRRNRG
jgi:hypothetical protein